MAVPKVRLRERKGKRGISYFIDFAINGIRHREIGDRYFSSEFQTFHCQILKK